MSENEGGVLRCDGGLVDTTAAGWSVQRAAPQDIDDVERIWAAQFDDPEDHQGFLAECFDPEHGLYSYTQAFIATDGRARAIAFGLAAIRNTGDMHGYTTLPESEFSGRDGYLYLSAVEDGWRRKGIGSHLFARRLRWCVEQGANAVYGIAWQNPEGPTSDPLFRKFQFEAIAEAPDDYYRGRDCPVCDGECDCDGVIYRRKL